MTTEIINVNGIELHHIMADDGKVLTNGDTITKEIYFSQTNPMDSWYEIDYEDETDEE